MNKAISALSKTNNPKTKQFHISFVACSTVSYLRPNIEDVPGASEHIFVIVLYCYKSFKQL